MPMTDDMMAPAALPEDLAPIWVSEAMVDLYGYSVGRKCPYPLVASNEFLVAGVWRDYGRQFGAVMQLADYRS